MIAAGAAGEQTLATAPELKDEKREKKGSFETGTFHDQPLRASAVPRPLFVGINEAKSALATFQQANRNVVLTAVGW